VILAHAGSAITGLVLWISFLATGVVALAWVATALLLPTAGFGMGLVTLGLPFRPSAADRPAPPSRRRRTPVLIIALHGLLAFTTLLLVLLAAIGAGG
jgi:hypothetical protein